MTIRNKIIVELWLDLDSHQDEGEVNISWRPINFGIYSELFPEIISESVYIWLSENELDKETPYELIMAHVVERDGAGAVHSEYFEQISIERGIS